MKVYIKVKASEELPEEDLAVFAHEQSVYPLQVSAMLQDSLWYDANSGGEIEVEYWLKEINLPDEDEIDEIFTRRSANPPYTDIRNIRAIEGANFILKKLK